MSEQIPTPGRIVHFVLKDGPNKGKHRAAVVTSDWGGPNINLAVFHDQTSDADGAFANGAQTFAREWSAPYSETPELGTWHWPERV